MINPQKPFAYEPRQHKNKQPKVGLNFTYETLPANYMALCRYCGKVSQKFKGEVCARCQEKSVVGFVHPWLLLPPYYMLKFSYIYTSTARAFACGKCGREFRPFYMFSALCNHPSHLARTCRFCCTVTSRSVVAEIAVARAKMEEEKLRFGDVKGRLSVGVETTTPLKSVVSTRSYGSYTRPVASSNRVIFDFEGQHPLDAVDTNGSPLDFNFTQVEIQTAGRIFRPYTPATERYEVQEALTPMPEDDPHNVAEQEEYDDE
jgi:hypothetical protein